MKHEHKIKKMVHEFASRTITEDITCPVCSMYPARYPKWQRAIFLFINLFVFSVLFSCNSEPHYSYPPVKGDMVIIDVSLLGDARPEFFSVILNKKRVDFFVIKIDGSVKSYLDACADCYQFNKGFHVEGSYIICAHCGTRYPLDSLHTGLGGCHPTMPLKGKLKDEEYSISLKEIEKAAKYF